MTFLNTTYILMLLFVFWTLFLISLKMSTPWRNGITKAALIGRLLWCALGTFFFHSVW